MSSLKFISNYNLEILGRVIIRDNIVSGVECDGYDNSYEWFFLGDSHADYAIVWLDVKIFPAYSNREPGDINCMAALNKEVDEYLNKLDEVKDGYKKVIFVNWDDYFKYRGDGFANYTAWGNSYILDSIRIKTAERYLIDNYVLVIDFRFIAEKLGQYGLDERLYYATKCPFSLDYLNISSQEIKALVDVINGQQKKLIVLDLDNTLWGGVVGDDGVNGIRLGGHDCIGEAYLDFQKEIKKLKNSGYLLAISSKNNEDVAFKALCDHPDIILKKNDFVSAKINWKNKSENILEIIQNVNIGMDSVVFFDDSSYEREEVGRKLKEIFIPEMPKEAFYYKKHLKEIRCFDKLFYTEEDKTRTNMYQVDETRKVNLSGSMDKEDWLRNIDLRLSFEIISGHNEERVFQLLNKTNQFNLSGRKFTRNEFDDIVKNHRFLIFRCADKFGEYGLISVVVYKICKKALKVTDFVMSCRVISRNVENAIIGVLASCAIENKCETIKMRITHTGRNIAIREFLKGNMPCCDHSETDYYINDLESEIIPDYISIQRKL